MTVRTGARHRLKIHADADTPEFHTERSIDELWASNVEVIKKRLSNQVSTPAR